MYLWLLSILLFVQSTLITLRVAYRLCIKRPCNNTIIYMQSISVRNSILFLLWPYIWSVPQILKDGDKIHNGCIDKNTMKFVFVRILQVNFEAPFKQTLPMLTQFLCKIHHFTPNLTLPKFLNNKLFSNYLAFGVYSLGDTNCLSPSFLDLTF